MLDLNLMFYFLNWLRFVTNTNALIYAGEQHIVLDE